MKIIFFGDVIGKTGRRGIAKVLPALQEKYEADIVIANAENLAHGYGITEKTIEEMATAGVTFFTSGNHIWKKKEGITMISLRDTNILRPANYPENNPGYGYKIVEIGSRKLLIINLLGRVFMREDINCPFLAFDEILKKIPIESVHGVFVDFHAEATSEKYALFRYIDGRASTMVGTHTHVATADTQLTQKGTGYITDVGMNGPLNSVIGHKTEQIVQRFLSQIDTIHEVEEEGPCLINCVFVEIDPSTRKTIKIEHITQNVNLDD